MGPRGWGTLGKGSDDGQTSIESERRRKEVTYSLTRYAKGVEITGAARRKRTQAGNLSQACHCIGKSI